MSSTLRYAKLRSLITFALAALISLPLTFMAPTIALAAGDSGGKAVVITTEGDTLTVRSGPGQQFPAIGALAQGTIVTVLAGPQAGDDGVTWMQVQGGGLTGWCSAAWLGDATSAPAATPAAPVATPTAAPATAVASVAPTAAPTAPPGGTPDPGSTLTGSGSPRVSGTNGRGARLRATPSLNGAIVTLIPEGAEVTVTGANVTAEGYAWVPVTYLALSGWVASGLLAAEAVSPAPAAPPTPTPTIVPVAAPPPSAPPAPPTAPPPPAPTAVPVAPTPAPASTPSGGVGLTVGGNATIVDTDGFSLRIRAKPGLDAPIVSFAPPGAVVAVTAGPQNDSTGAPWWGVTYGGSGGWVLGEYLAPVSGTTAAPPAPTAPPAPASNTRPAPSATPSPATTPASTGGRGQAIAATALRYLGVPYVYGGTTPSGWDCSGFVGYIYQAAAGITLPRTTAQQYRVGTTISAAQVQAGDIVFFADTFGPGITHNGIALGDGRFIHARSEGYGTTISSLSDPYWSGHFAGAQRP